MTNKKNKTKKALVAAPEIKLDLGCGRNKQPGFTGVDFYEPTADVRIDLFKFPWPWKDGSVTEIFASHFIEHIPRHLRWAFFEECYRILKDGGILRGYVPSWKSERAFGDMTHEWPPVTTFAFYYLNKGWREANKLTYGPYDIKCDFDAASGPTALAPAFASRSHETQVFSCTHYLESYQDMWFTLTKRPKEPVAP
jgi:Methyltransferase domain